MHRLWIILALINTLFTPVAEAVMKWQYRSSSATKAYYATGLGDVYQRGATDPTLTAGPSGTFGGYYLNMAAGPWIVFPGGDNAPIGATQISVLWRLVPISSGAPSGNKALLALGTAGNFNDNQYGGIMWGINNAGKMYMVGGTRASGTNYFSPGFYTLTNAFSFTADQPIDIWFTWDGTTNANGVKVYSAQNGNTAALLEQFTANTALQAMSREQITEILIRDFWNNTNNNAFHINEIAIFDTVEDPTSYGARTDFIPSPTGATYEGYTHTSLSAGDVRSGTAFGPGPGSQTGTLVVPATGDVKTGVAFGAASAETGTYTGSDRWTCPLDSQLSTGVQLKCDSTSLNLTGTRDTITNVMTNASMTGQSLEATLTAE